MGRLVKFPTPGSSQVFELPEKLQGDLDAPTRIHWKAPDLETRRLHACIRQMAVGDGPAWAAYLNQVSADLVVAVENYEDDEGNPVETMEDFLEHAEPGVMSAFVEHARNKSELNRQEKKDSKRPSSSSSTADDGGTDGTTPEAKDSPEDRSESDGKEKRPAEDAADSG